MIISELQFIDSVLSSKRYGRLCIKRILEKKSVKSERRDGIYFKKVQNHLFSTLFFSGEFL